MSKYTTELRHVIDTYTRNIVLSWFTDYNLADYLTTAQITIINNAGLWTKEKLANKILNHYYMREIGLETPAIFKHYAKVKMSELMESYLPLIYSSSIVYDPLENVNFTEELERSIEGEGSNSGVNIYSDTPQGQINKTSILDGSHATNTEGVESDSSSSSSENYTKHIYGNNGATMTNQKLIEQYRKNIIAIDKEIINELSSLFMGIY